MIGGEWNEERERTEVRYCKIISEWLMEINGVVLGHPSGSC